MSIYLSELSAVEQTLNITFILEGKILFLKIMLLAWVKIYALPEEITGLREQYTHLKSGIRLRN